MQRGRTFDNRWDAETAAQVAAALREDRQRTWQMWVAIVIALLAIVLGAVWIAGDEVVLGALLAVVGVSGLSSPFWQRRRERWLARAEQANREVAERDVAAGPA